MAHLSTVIGQAALQNFFPHLSMKQEVGSYNPQYNGWDTADDMPKYNKINTKPTAQADYLKQGEKLNTQLINMIFHPQTKNRVQNQQIPYQNHITKPSSNNNQSKEQNQQYYNKPIPYQYQTQIRPSQNFQPQYNTSFNNQMYPQLSQSNYPQSYPRKQQQYPKPTTPIPKHSTTIPNNNNKQLQAAKNFLSNNQRIPQNNQRPSIKQASTNQNLQRKLTAQEMDAILGSQI